MRRGWSTATSSRATSCSNERGNCLLADFGIAKILEGADTLTATGGLIGTPKYMSPEQGMGTPIDGRSDVYSLGVVLYEMATGQVPFEAETPMAVVVKHIHDPLPAPRQINPDIPEQLQRMIFRAMHKTPSERFASAAAMVESMSAIATTGAPSPDEPTATLPIGGTPPLPLVSINASPPSAEVTVPNTVATRTIAPPSPPVDATTPPDRESGRSDEPGVGARKTSDPLRPVVIGVAALVVVALLFFFGRGDDPETAPPLVSTPRLLPEVSDTAATPDPPETTAELGDAGVAEPGRATATSAGQPDAAATAADGAPDAAPVAALDLAAEVAARTQTAAATNRENALRSAVTRAEADRRRADAEAAARDPFPDQGDGTFLDSQVGVRWTAVSFPIQGSEGWLWPEANAHCEGLRRGSRDNWRLPTRPELDSVLQRLDPARYPWGLTLWSADRPVGVANRLWVTNSPLYAPEWSSEVRDASARRLTHRAVCVAAGGN